LSSFFQKNVVFLKGDKSSITPTPLAQAIEEIGAGFAFGAGSRQR
jgi:hypothetical protein